MKIFGVTGWKNNGKTTLVARLVTHLTAQGMRVATIKHAHHGARLDEPGTDTAAHAEAGAAQVLLATSGGTSLVTPGPMPVLSALLGQLAPADLVLVEGWKFAPFPKIEAIRKEAVTQAPIGAQTPWVRAYASDHLIDTDRPVFPLNDIAQIADFVRAEGKPSADLSALRRWEADAARPAPNPHQDV